ncbi:MAG: antibiotic biosynthesis monooxygenase [Desulfobacter sp.]|nr:antibiotic biosynthesis monooxygenase [Desulfobacter sp.]WDP85429.1 MAG: antibiotic biosynthesis monooxygenase [Desulfobacter sp.]
MIVKVIIQREVTPGKEQDFFDLLRQLRFNALQQPGYISGETLICADDTRKVLIISKWSSIEEWKDWKADNRREKMDQALTKLQKSPAVYEPYVFSKFKAAAALEFPPPLQKIKL